MVVAVLELVGNRKGSEPDVPANRSQAIRSGTNGTSGAAGSRRWPFRC